METQYPSSPNTRKPNKDEGIENDIYQCQQYGNGARRDHKEFDQLADKLDARNANRNNTRLATLRTESRTRRHGQN